MDKELKESLDTSYEILEDMHLAITHNQLLSDVLIDEAETAIKALKLFNPDDYETRKIIVNTISILEEELKLNAEIKKNKERSKTPHFVTKSILNHV